jgi:hypothetical protein
MARPDTDNTSQALAVSEIDPAEVVERPKAAEQQPVTVDYNDTIVVPPQDVNDDIITITIRDDELPDAILKAIMSGLAEEQSALKNLRLQREKENKDFSKLCISRGTLLKYMSEAVIQRQALVGGSGDLDLKGPKFREIIKMFLQVIKDTFDEVKIPPEYRDLFFHALGHNLLGWEQKAEKIIKTIR